MAHDPYLPRCEKCGGAATYRTWTEARRAVNGLQRQRKALRGFRAYQCSTGQGFHIGRATDHQRRKARAA